MNLVESSLARRIAAESIRKETPFSGKVEIAGKNISVGDTIDIANKKGDMVRYTVTGIVLDKGPARLLLKSTDSNRRTFKDLDTLNNNPNSFRKVTDTKKLVDRILTGTLDTPKPTPAVSRSPEEQERSAILDNAAPHNRTKDTKKLVDRILTGTLDTPKPTPAVSRSPEEQERSAILDNAALGISRAERKDRTPLTQVQQELNTSVSILKQEADRIDTLRETIAHMLTPEQQALVQAYAEQTQQTSLLTHREGSRFLWDEMQADARQHQDLVGRNLKADEEIMAMRGFRPMTKEDMPNIVADNLTQVLGTGSKEHVGATPLNPEEFSKPHLAQASNVEPRLREAEFNTAYDKARQPKTYLPTRRTDSANYVGVGHVDAGDIYKVLAGTEKTIYEANPIDGIATRLGVKTNITQQQLLNQTERLHNIMQSSNQEQTFFNRIIARAQGFFKRNSTPNTRTGLAIPVAKYQPEKPTPKTPTIETIPKPSDDTTPSVEVDTRPAPDNVVHLADFKKPTKSMSDKEEDAIIAEMEEQMREIQAKQEPEKRRGSVTLEDAAE
jgi:hypothetical protein